MLRHCRKLPSLAESISVCGAILEQNAVQPESKRAHCVGGVPADQVASSVTASETETELLEVAVTRSAVNQSSKSVVREIRSLRSVGAGGGRPPPVTRSAGG